MGNKYGHFSNGDQTREKMLDYIRTYWLAHKTGPSTRQIMIGCNLNTTSAVDYEVTKLIRMGLLTKERGVPRSVRPADMEVSFGDNT